MSGSSRMPAVAVCLVTYRRPAMLRRALESLERLRFEKCPGLEVAVVVVDNDAEGEAYRFCAGLRDRYRWPLTAAVEPVRGISFARNRAVELARARAGLIAFLDDDTEADPSWLDEAVVAMERYPADVVQGAVISRLPGSAGEWVRRGGFFDRPRPPTGTPLPIALTNGVVLRTAALEGFSPPFEACFAFTGGEDDHFFRQLVVRGRRIVFCDEARVYETIPESKVSIRYLVTRAYRQTINFNRSLFLVYSPWSVLPRRLPRALYRLAVGGLQVVLLGALRRRWLVQGLCNLAKGLGTFSAYLGLRSEAYRTIHGA